MKILFIAMMVFFLQLSVAIVDVTGLYSYNIATQDDWKEDVEKIESEQYLRSDVTKDVSTSFGFGDFIVGLKSFIDVIARVLKVHVTLEAFGVPKDLSGLLSAPVYFLYGLGIAQFIANRGTRGMR